MGNDLSIWALVLDASAIVQGVMLLLMIASLVSWAVIFQKGRVISRSRRQADQFETAFWSGGDLTALYRSIETKGRAGTGEQSIFESGFGEYSRLRQLGTPADQLLEGSRRAMRVAQMREMDRLERNLAMLATVGSTSPYVGLFGTVWGIMSAFHNLGNVQQATLAAVAPGIAEHWLRRRSGCSPRFRGDRVQPIRDQVSRLELRFDTFVESSRRFCSVTARPRGASVASMAKLVRRRKLMGEINVVPYIDVMLVLLVIFMITAPLLKEGVKVDLPAAGAKPIDPGFMDKHPPLIVTIDSSARLYINLAQTRTKPASEATVSARTAALLRRDPQTPILVRADTTVPYGAVVRAMCCCNMPARRRSDS